MEGYICVLLAACLTCLPGLSRAGIDKEKVCGHNMESVSRSGGRPQTGKSPFRITTTQNRYIPGRPTQVSIKATTPLLGFVLQARRVGTSDVVGRFQDVPHWVSLASCEDTNNTLYAWFNTPSTRNLTFTWVSPEVYTGTVQFLYTQPGDTTCNQETCIYLVTSRVEGSNAHFEISAKADWAAIGFSSDDRMGGDDVFMCMRTRSSGDVRHYWNDYAYQSPHLQDMNPLFNRQVEVTEDGRIACRFSRPLKVSNGNQFNIDLNNDWFQLYAWGPLSQSGTLMRHTLDNPSVSSTKMTLLRKRDVISGAAALGVSGLRCVLPVALLWILVPRLLPST